MTSVRSRLAALAVLAALFVGPGAPLFAQDRHPVCAAKQHDCGKTAKITSCCCGDAAAPHDSGTPAQPRVDISSSATATAMVSPVVVAVPPDTRIGAVQTSPPRSSPVDLPTLFASLLI